VFAFPSPSLSVVLDFEKLKIRDMCEVLVSDPARAVLMDLQLGVTAFVEASYTGRRLYESCGFVVTEDVRLEGGKVKEEWKDYGDNGVAPYLFMIRENKAANGSAN
jgi:hypothetical protein